MLQRRYKYVTQTVPARYCKIFTNLGQTQTKVIKNYKMNVENVEERYLLMIKNTTLQCRGGRGVRHWCILGMAQWGIRCRRNKEGLGQIMSP